MKKFGIILSIVATLFIGCGGENSDDTQKTQITASVEASIVKGATVCEFNTNNCAISNSDGKVTLYVTKLPVELEVKIKNLVLGTIEANSKTVSINPVTLSDNNETLAWKIGAFIHALVGDTEDSKNLVDLSNITITKNINEPIMNLLKENKVFTVDVNNHTIEVSDKVYLDNLVVEYNLSKFMNIISNVNDFMNYIKTKYDISNLDNVSSDKISGQVWYTEEDINETVKFNNDGTFSDSWVEDGKTYTKTGNWSISDGVLVLNYDSDNYGGIKKAYVAKFNNGIVYVSLDVDGNVVNSGIVNNTNYPLTEKLSNIWGYDWYKITAFYDGDTRYIGNDVIFNTDEEYIGLKANKKENQDSRAQVRAFLPNVKGFSADINLITDNIYSLFQILAISKGNINISKPIGDINNTSNLNFYAGLNVRKNSIYYWWSIYDSKTGKYYNGNVDGENYEYNLTNLVTEGSDVTVEVTSDNNSITYKVYNKANGDVIFNKSLNLSDINITNFKGFNVVSFRSDVRDNKANQNNDDAIEESLNYVNNFKIINNLNNDTLDKFLNSIDFTPNEITTSTFKGKKLIIDDLNVTVYFTSDGKFYARGEGNYSVDENNNVLIFNGKEGNVIGYIAFNNLTNENADYAFDKIGDGISKGSLKIESFDETNFNPYPSYVNNGEKVVLDVDDDFLNLNTENKVQFNIKNDNDNGVQCTTNYSSFDDFKNSFSNGELTLNASKNEISCVFLNNNNPISPTKQTEVIQFIDNNDGTYQVHMISGYFSGNDFNITNIDDSLMYIDNN